MADLKKKMAVDGYEAKVPERVRAENEEKIAKLEAEIGGGGGGGDGGFREAAVMVRARHAADDAPAVTISFVESRGAVVVSANVPFERASASVFPKIETRLPYK